MDFLDRLEATNSLEGIQALVTGLRDTLGIEHAIYHVVGDTGREYGALTYDQGWVEHYIRNRYYRIDPVVKAAFAATGPVDWRNLDWSGAPARRLIGEAVEGGIGKQGHSVPIRGAHGQFALFSVTSYDSEDRWTRFGQENLRGLVLAAHFIHQRAHELQGASGALPDIALAPRERDVLTHLSLGRSRGEAAEKLGISEHTLRAYLDSARIKLGAMNSIHAIAVAVSRGLVIP
ncbi:LuxR family transcriptional regulator [Halovulum dunhuangense]|uniref:LuxR family transcriptional regulator n=1 Tax=Halovulum dunhuangense TaxID=1505036 RepID=A0A849KYT0_9RHOB|nr:LuxR family transcriptional regulator [Halovulum dunhuangense]NNU78912.1 LuxR family transcriptional regulator [Halovulum dunhuangense]